MPRAHVFIASLTLAAAVACHGVDEATGPAASSLAADGGVTMLVDGAAWRSARSGDHVMLSNEILSLSAIGDSGGTHSLIITLAGLIGPATYSLNSGSHSNAIISNPGGAWGTGFAGGTGSITITAIDATHVAGTFSFDAKPGSGSATGTVSVRSGLFDIAF